MHSSLSGNSATTLSLGTVVQNQGKQDESARVTWQILDASGKTVATAETPVQLIAVDGLVRFSATAKIADELWSVDEPNLYSAIVTVESGGKARDAWERVSFGVRTAVFDPERGFFLNGKSIKSSGHV